MTRVTPLTIAALFALFALSACDETPPPAPRAAQTPSIQRFSAEPALVASGERATLRWSVEDAQSLSIRTLSGETLEGVSGGEGSLEVTVEEDTVYQLTAIGRDGSDVAAAAVQVQREVLKPLFEVFPREIRAGQSATLVWSVPGASSVSITTRAGEAVHTAHGSGGSLTVSPHHTTGYTLTAGDATAEVELAVQVAIEGFVLSTPEADAGDSVTVSWKTGGAEELTLSASGRGTLHTVTEPGELREGSFVDTVPATLPEDGVLTYTLSARQGTRIETTTLVLYVGADPRFLSSSIPQVAKLGSTYQVAWTTAKADDLEVLVDGVIAWRAPSEALVHAGTVELAAQPVPVMVTLRASNARGGRAEVSALVTPVDVPTVNAFAATPAVIPNGGEPSTVSWSIPHARHVKLSVKNGPKLYEGHGAAMENASFDVYPNRLTEYVLEADNLAGDSIAPQTLVVDVTSPARLVFSTTEPLPIGAAVQLVGATVGGDLQVAGAVPLGKPGEQFVDISTTGTALPFASGDDTVSKLLTLPSPFYVKLHGARVGGASLSVSINGWMAFSSTTISGPSVPSNTFPMTGLAPYAIAPYLEDLQADSTSKVLWRIDTTPRGGRLIVQWNAVPYYSSAAKKVTFQAQLYEEGEVVFAYGPLVGLTSSEVPAIGISNQDQSAAATPAAADLNASAQPAPADTFTFFASPNLTLPATVFVREKPFNLLVARPTHPLQLSDGPAVMAPGAFHVSELNFDPAASAPLGEWFEVANNTASAIDLQGWILSWGGNPATHYIASSLVIPPGDVRVFGQSNDPAQNGGIAVDYVVPGWVALSNTSGSVAFEKSGAAYTRSSWSSTASGGVGKSARFDPPNPKVLFATGFTSVSCDGLSTYGTQIGTPGQKDPRCFPYTLTNAAPNGFQSILGTGTVAGALTGATGTDSAYATINLPRAINVFGQPVSSLYVSSDGFVSTSALTSSYGSNDSIPSTSAPNGVIAPYWDDLQGNPSGSSVVWQQFDPDATPGTGDEYTLVSWENWKRFSYAGGLNFQVKFIEGTRDIEFHFGAMTASTQTYAQGLSATTWLEAPTGRWALPINLNSATPGIQPDTGYRFTFTP